MSIRARYEDAVRALRHRAAALLDQGVPVEQVARTLHAERLALASRFKELTPEAERRIVLARTMRAYGNPVGPSIDFLRARGKSWEAIIEGATRPGLNPVGSPSPCDSVPSTPAAPRD
ncbi:cell wall-binding protein [Rhodovarius crocodyli]|uniref:Cell wall-binding protein n=1 Tax=Rhodovarius crocodyli TaxID=1979269 RepID=A0A437MED5_9PROT|nr:cell wall-binding protein [Rhodovarius crocodyli]